MKKTLILTTITTLLMPLSAIAEPSGHMGMQGRNSDKHMQSGDQSGTMMKMQDRMKKMISQMDKIHQTKNPKERDKLIEAHMKYMNEGMMEMRGMGGGMMMGMMSGRKGSEMMKGKKGSGMMGNGNMMQDSKMSKGMKMDDTMMRMGDMEKRMDMMQMMMEQMMQSRQAERSIPRDDHMK